jgi:hypothetical protein
MGIFDRMRGIDETRKPMQETPASDEQAIARYRYMLRTAPPEAIEQAHAEAFAKLTPEQRRMLLDQLRNETPEAERAAVARDVDTPQSLARLATRAEVRQPGTLERVFGRAGAVPGWGGMIAGSLLGSMAGTVLGTMIAQNFLGAHPFGAEQTDLGRGADAQPHDDSVTHALDDTSGDIDAGDTWDV